jgi:hypothetical protein
LTSFPFFRPHGGQTPGSGGSTSLGLPADEDFDYDDAGNREDPASASDYDYDVSNRITVSPGLAYAFDADGNLETIQLPKAAHSASTGAHPGTTPIVKTAGGGPL